MTTTTATETPTTELTADHIWSKLSDAQQMAMASSRRGVCGLYSISTARVLERYRLIESIDSRWTVTALGLEVARFGAAALGLN